MTSSSNSFRFRLFPRYAERVRVRCFLISAFGGYEIIRWLRDDGDVYVQQVMVMDLSTGELKHTANDPNYRFYLCRLLELIKHGTVKELT